MPHRLHLARLFLLSLLIFAPGIWSISIFTDIDEYHRIYRTALTMMETGEWLVPRLDGTLRVRKPPLIYWMTGLNFKLFGASVITGRSLNVLFCALLVLVTALIAYEQIADGGYALSAGLVLMSMMGIAISSKFMMYDAPVAVMSGLAFYAFLVWCRTMSRWALLGMTSALTAAFLIKGPAAFVVAGSGIASVTLTTPILRRKLWDKRRVLLLHSLLFLVCGLSWFVFVSWLHPQETFVEMQKELSARKFGDINATPLLALLLFTLPWTFLPLSAAFRAEPKENSPLKNAQLSLIIFLAFSLVPFFFFRFIPRYILGSLIPFALLTAMSLEYGNPSQVQRKRRWGAILASLVVFLWLFIAIWFRVSYSAVTLVLSFYTLFVVAWWRGSKPLLLAISSALLWSSLVGFLLPSFRSNAIPKNIVDRVRNGSVILYKTPEPAFLPITLERSLEFKGTLSPSIGSLLQSKVVWIFVKQRFQKDFEREVENLGIDVEIFDSYTAFPSMEGMTSQFRNRKTFWRRWVEAARTRSLQPFMETFLLYRIVNRG